MSRKRAESTQPAIRWGLLVAFYWLAFVTGLLLGLSMDPYKDDFTCRTMAVYTCSVQRAGVSRWSGYPGLRGCLHDWYSDCRMGLGKR
jgi:hypothetical protein